jgi:hypothetical protein
MTVLIGEVSGGGGGGGGGANPVILAILEGVDPAILKIAAQILALNEAAFNGLPLIEPC